MKHYVLNRESQWGGFPATDLFILGATRAAAAASDFTDADTSQTFTLMTPAAGDIVTYPLAQAYTKIGFAGTDLTAITLDVGFAGGEEFIKDGSMFTVNAGAGSVLCSQAGGPKVFDGATTLSAVVVTTGANLSAITAGELWIFVCLTRITDQLLNRTA
jgi:hypothetical protein